MKLLHQKCCLGGQQCSTLSTVARKCCSGWQQCTTLTTVVRKCCSGWQQCTTLTTVVRKCCSGWQQCTTLSTRNRKCCLDGQICSTLSTKHQSNRPNDASRKLLECEALYVQSANSTVQSASNRPTTLTTGGRKYNPPANSDAPR